MYDAVALDKGPRHHYIRSMARFYTNVAQHGSRILTRHVEDGGRRIMRKTKFEPTLFLKSATKTPTGYTDIYGNPLTPFHFNSITEAKEFVKKYEGVGNAQLFGNNRYAYQYIAEEYPDFIEFDIDHIKIFSLDIETTSQYGFPNSADPLEEILVITVQDARTKKITTFGTRPFDVTGIRHVKNKTGVAYIECANEEELIKNFLSFWEEQSPDVITGWNIQFFDIPYLYNRILRVAGEDVAKMLSPWDIIRTREVFKHDREHTVYELVGISTLDYLDLYQKFTYEKREKYSLDHIAEIELGKNKLESGFETFKDFYTNDWHHFVEYNIVDTELVDELEDKMKLIEMAITMAFYAKCNFSDVFSAVRTWHSILYNLLWKKNIVIPFDKQNESSRIAGAFVKQPVPGRYDWVCSFDAASLYPSIIMQYNMSPETLVQTEHLNCSPETLLNGGFEKQDYLKEKNYAMAANGYCYRRDKLGIFPEVVQMIFDDRVTFKKKMIAAEKEVVRLEEELRDGSARNPELVRVELHQALKNVSRYNNFQMSRKILLNSLYGSMANRFFKFYDLRIAEGITLTGQYIIQHVTAQMNAFLNKFMKTDNVDYAFYSDTDSCYITLKHLVEKHLSSSSTKECIDALDVLCQTKISKTLDRASQQIAEETNAYENKIYFKREAIARAGIWVSKKRYILSIFDMEGVRFEIPKLKVMGLEIVRSSTPAVVRQYLKEAVKMAIGGSEQDLHTFVAETEKTFRTLPLEKIAFPRGVNGIVTYRDPINVYRKKTPIHVRASLLYNKLVMDRQLDKKYEQIRDGDKIKFVYLKKPNPIQENVIGFLGTLPAEFGLHLYVDYPTMFQRAFLKPMRLILSTLNWTERPVATLNDLF